MVESSPAGVELLREAYDAFKRRDFERILAPMQDDVDWPNGMECGRVLGKDAVRAYWGDSLRGFSHASSQAFSPRGQIEGLLLRFTRS